MSSNQRRHLGGQPTGGQFAPWNHGESKVELMTTKQPLDIGPFVAQILTTQELNELRKSGLGGEATIAWDEEDSVDWTPADGVGTFRVARMGDTYRVYHPETGDSRITDEASDVHNHLRMLRANVLGMKAASASSVYADKVVAVVFSQDIVEGDGRWQDELGIGLQSVDGVQTELWYGTLHGDLEIRRDGRSLAGDEFDAAAADVCSKAVDGETDASPVERLKACARRILDEIYAHDDVPDRVE